MVDLGPSNPADAILGSLNPQQRAAASHGSGPLLIVAGAGTGKTATLVHRVAWLISQGVDPQRILLLTFTRRAAEEMLRRVDAIIRRMREQPADGGGAAIGAGRIWGGTFHAVSTRLLRRYGARIKLPAQFTILDRTDAEDLMRVVRNGLGFGKTEKRFPQKGTCMDIYSRCVNARQKLAEVLPVVFPWCRDWEEQLGQLFNGYVDRKESAATLDYDDLLLYWRALLADEEAGSTIRKLFEHVLVDEYQDTNTLQADILAGLRPDGQGLTVVGDDAQSIYSFRAANVRNILDFPQQFPGATIVTLEQNYRSTQPILAATNQIIAQARERFTKNLWSTRDEGQKPILMTCKDETDQSDAVVRRVLDDREAGIPLRRQAVLFRASYHSMLLEAELARRNILFHKYGGLKFIEAAHVKDLLAFLRLADNPRDVVSGLRVLPLLPGVGPGKAAKLLEQLQAARGDFSVWRGWKAPSGATTLWPALVQILEDLARSDKDLPAQVYRVRQFYTPLMEQQYDNPAPRARDLEQLELIAARYRSRRRMLLEMALDPPSSTQDLAGRPLLDDDYLVLSTIHSAKGLEWDCVHVIHAADGNIPSDMATGSTPEIEEELRLFYVALTRAKNRLYVYYPLRYYRYRPGVSDSYGFSQRTRFLPMAVMTLFEQQVGAIDDEDPAAGDAPHLDSAEIRRETKGLWS